MKKLMSFGIALGLGLIASGVANATPGPVTTVDLMATATQPSFSEKVGEVSVWVDAGTLYLQYRVTQTGNRNLAEDWCMTATDFRVGTTRTNGVDHPMALNCAIQQTYTVPVTWKPGRRNLYITANASLKRLGGIDDLPKVLPTEATLTLNRPLKGATSYFNATVSDDTFLNGVHASWCVDPADGITQGQAYSVKIYSGSARLPDGIVGHPDLLPLVNWLINQDYVGQSSPTGLGLYTYGDIQRTIWSLIGTQVADAGLGNWSQDRVDELKVAATTNGTRFIPGCAQNMSLLMVPVDSSGTKIAQVVAVEATLIQMGIPCEAFNATTDLQFRFRIPGTGD
jgi:hypothetical protein